MKKFLSTIVSFGGTLSIILIVLDVLLTFLFWGCEDRKYASWNYIFFDSTPNDLVINGSSRAWVQYDPFILDTTLNTNSYNLGINGSAIDRQMVKYETFCRYHGYPKYLIQNIDLFTLSQTDNYEREQFFPYFWDRTFLSHIDVYEEFSIAEKIIPCYRYLCFESIKTLINAAIGAEELVCKGYHGQSKSWNGEAFEKYDTLVAELDTTMYKEFRMFLYRQHQSGTKIVFVYAPVYHGVVEKCVNMDEMYDTYEQLAQEFDIPILNYNEAAICYDTTYFYNATHLNKEGAEVFSEQLAHDVDSLGILRK